MIEQLFPFNGSTSNLTISKFDVRINFISVMNPDSRRKEKKGVQAKKNFTHGSISCCLSGQTEGVSLQQEWQHLGMNNVLY